ncbi:MAG: hypothetical protein J5I93_05680 [Pirellulaceae bacterium]|nr:hypothetical protein [Pirellulaceae bacterium]
MNELVNAFVAALLELPPAHVDSLAEFVAIDGASNAHCGKREAACRRRLSSSPMSVTSFFEKCVGVQQQRTKTAIASYQELVAGIATGEEPNPAEVERLLPPGRQPGAPRSVAPVQENPLRHAFSSYLAQPNR